LFSLIEIYSTRIDTLVSQSCFDCGGAFERGSPADAPRLRAPKKSIASHINKSTIERDECIAKFNFLDMLEIQMDDEPNQKMTTPDASIQEISTAIWKLAEQAGGNTLLLLSLLRDLELLHRKIRSELLEPSLPQTRQHLYKLVKEIEEHGGWPYIERMKLQELLRRMESQESNTEQENSV
jgi:hypothetical protein